MSNPAKQKEVIRRLREVAGRRSVLIGTRATRPYLEGYRSEVGDALAVVRPRSLVTLWRALQIAVANDLAVVMQAANTSLTGGSTPTADNGGRDVLLISTLAVDAIHPILNGHQVICLPGSTLYRLERTLEPFGRDPHSVIGSSCIGASVVGGVCNNSGGALVRRGPAYTEMALFARVTATGQLELVNHLGIRLPADPEEALSNIEHGLFGARDIEQAADRRASDDDYATRVRAVDEATPARFNADPDRLHDASGCAGKLCVFAVRLDTFPRDGTTRTFYIGTNSATELGDLRRDLLDSAIPLPIAAEYIGREAFDLAANYGKDSFLAVRYLGTNRLPLLLRLQARVDLVASRVGLGRDLADRLMQRLASWLPCHLPDRIKIFRDRFEHHLILKVADNGIEPTADYLKGRFPSSTGDLFVCSDGEARDAFLHRFVTASAAVRYQKIHRSQVADVVALDVALRRNDRDWEEKLPRALLEQISHRLYYGHFFCHVFHQDYVVKAGCDVARIKDDLLTLMDARGAEYPAEHNVGHRYAAKPALERFYRVLDPTNSFNPGLGRTSAARDWS